MSPDLRQPAAGVLFAAASGLLYGSTTLLVKAAAGHPYAKGTLYSLGAALLLAPFLWKARIPRRDWPRVLLMAFFGAALAPALILHGLEQANASDAGILLTLEIVATAALAFGFLQERVGRSSATGLACLLGAAVAVALASQGGKGSTGLGLALVTGAAIAWGVDNTVSAGLVGRHPPLQVAAAKLAIGTAMLALAWGGWLAMGQAAPLPPASTDWGLLAATGAGVAFGTILFYLSLQRIGAARTIALNVPVGALAAAAGGALFLQESLGWLHAAALLLVTTGMALLWSGSGDRLGSDRQAG